MMVVNMPHYHKPRQPKTLASKDINVALSSLQLVGVCLQRCALCRGAVASLHFR